jgi:primosomal protein N' (replication factor Y)
MTQSSRTSAVQVLLPIPFKDGFDYLPSGGEVRGARVLVPFGKSHRIGVVWGSGPATCDPEHLRPVARRLDASPLFAEEDRRLLATVARYYHRGLGETVFTALPAVLRKKSDVAARITRWSLIPGASLPERPGTRQRLLIALLSEGSKTSAELKEEGISGDVLRRGEAQGWLTREAEQASPLRRCTPTTTPPVLTDEQQAAWKTLESNTNGFQPSLLFGDTGSGKTEIYMRAMEAVLNRGGQVLLLVPEIGLTPQMLRRLQNRLDGRLAVLHSGLTDHERALAWLAAARGEADVVVGTRSAVFVPLPRLQLIIVDEEHDASYKQQDGIRYHGRDVALIRAKQRQIPIVLGSATPSLETWIQAVEGRYHLLRLKQRPTGAPPPRWIFVDLRTTPHRRRLALPVIDVVRQTLERDEQVLVFLNRRGYAPAVMCTACGWLANCDRCDARMTLHQGQHRLICHHCDKHSRLPEACPSCGSLMLEPVGEGTEQMEQVLAEQLQPYPVVRIDRDSTRRKGSMEKALEPVRQGRPVVLVGTQMLAKGHHFPKVTLVVIVDADGMLFSADFRAPERGMQQLIQVAGRAGREMSAGRVLVQSFHTDHPWFSLLSDLHYEQVLAALMEERRPLGWPPFGHLALLRWESPKLESLQRCSSPLRRCAEAWSSDKVQCLGPVPSPMHKRQGRFRQQMLLVASDRKALHHCLDRWVDYFLNHEEGRTIARQLRWSIDVDPQEMS